MEEGPAGSSITEITEGETRLLVPSGALAGEAPPRNVAFFNPRAESNRDTSVAAYAAFLGEFEGPRTMLEPLSGVGARGLRAANETGMLQHAFLNDANPNAVALAEGSAQLNWQEHKRMISFSNGEACRFLLSGHAAGGQRGAIVDVDPFGSPAPFFDCAVRAVTHNGMISCTATDLQVLNGLFDAACRNRYGGTPIRGTTYGSETSIRMVLGCLRTVAARLGASIRPLLIEADMHYYRVYARVSARHADDARSEMGYSMHCDACGRRRLTTHVTARCDACGSGARSAGPLWRGPLFDAAFVGSTVQRMSRMSAGKRARRRLETAAEESAVQAGLFYTVDEMAARTGSSPPRIGRVVSDLRKAGFAASRTSLAPTGFRTDAPLTAISRVFS